MTTFVFNGWAAPPDTWAACAFGRDRVFDYLEQLEGEPERAMDALDEVVLVGFSMGGTTALRLLLAYPEKVRGLVLVAATARMMEDPASDWKGMSHHRRMALLYGTQMLNGGNPSPLFAPHNLERGLDVIQRTDLRDPLRSCAVARRLPVAVFQSERDGIVRPTNAAFLKEVFPRATVTLVPGSEHTLPPRIPAEIDAAVGRIVAAASGRKENDR